MELTLSVKGTARELSGILHSLGRELDEMSDDRLVAFLDSSTTQMVVAVGAIALASVDERPLSRVQLQSEARAKDEGELNGWMGSIGRAWAKQMGDENPFLGRQGPEGVYYRIDPVLAQKLVDLARRSLQGR